MSIEESYLASLRRQIIQQYAHHPTGCGGSFGELLCWELHTNGLTFAWLAEKWGLSLATLGELIWDQRAIRLTAVTPTSCGFFMPRYTESSFRCAGGIYVRNIPGHV